MALCRLFFCLVIPMYSRASALFGVLFFIVPGVHALTFDESAEFLRYDLLSSAEDDPMQVVRQVTGERVAFDILITKRELSVSDAFPFVGTRAFKLRFAGKVPLEKLNADDLDALDNQPQALDPLLGKVADRAALLQQLEIAAAPSPGSSKRINWAVVSIPILAGMLLLGIGIKNIRSGKKKNPLLA